MKRQPENGISCFQAAFYCSSYCSGPNSAAGCSNCWFPVPWLIEVKLFQAAFFDDGGSLKMYLAQSIRRVLDFAVQFV